MNLTQGTACAGVKPAKEIKIGDSTELMTMAGTVDNMPAARTHSASRLEMWMPMCRLVMDHHAKTGVENPMSQAGSTTMTARRRVRAFAP